MKLIFGTENEAKIQSMMEMLKGLDVEITGLNHMKIKVDFIDESGNKPLENAKIKALAYYKALKMPVFSCDSGLYLEGVHQCDQPGVHVRRVKGKVLNDDEMIEYYIGLAKRHGGELKAKYKNAICVVLDENSIFEYQGDDISSEEFIITSTPHTKRTPGFPLDSLSVEIDTGQYYMDKDSENDNSKMAEGFKSFFLRTVLK